jgi:hypothetical protein
MKFDKYDELEQKIEKKLWRLLIPDSGEAGSVQGELIRRFTHITYENYHNGNGNWNGYKYEVNLEGYSKEYFIKLGKEYLIEHPETLNKEETKEFLDEIHECEEVIDISYMIYDYFGVHVIPDFTKCTTTQEQINHSMYWDDYLYWMFNWLADHPLAEWDKEYISTLQKSFEIFRPIVPLGVTSYEVGKEWYRQNKCEEPDINGLDEMEAQKFIEISILNWIYENPDLVDLKGKDLGKSVKDVFYTKK